MTSLTLPALPTPKLRVRPLRRRVARVAVVARRRQPTSPQLAVLLATVLAIGIGVSILTTTDPYWWRLHFSELGTFHDFSGDVFNGTLVLAGAVIVVFALRVRRDLATLAARGHRAPRFLVGLMISGGIELAVVGLVPVDTFTFVHDRAASGVMMSFAAVLITVGREWRMLPPALRRSTAVVALALGGATPVFIAGLINLAAFEAIGFTLIFVWLGVFTSALHGTATRESAPVPDAVITPIEVVAADEPVIVRADRPRTLSPIALLTTLRDDESLVREIVPVARAGFAIAA